MAEGVGVAEVNVRVCLCLCMCAPATEFALYVCLCVFVPAFALALLTSNLQPVYIIYALCVCVRAWTVYGPEMPRGFAFAPADLFGIVHPESPTTPSSVRVTLRRAHTIDGQAAAGASSLGASHADF